MLNRLPRQLPSLSAILEDLGQPAPAAIAAALGSSLRSVRRWIATDAAPRAELLALFWLTRWGQSIVDAEAVNDAALQAGLARSRQVEVDELRGLVQRLVRLADFGAANDAHEAAALPRLRPSAGRSSAPWVRRRSVTLRRSRL